MRNKCVTCPFREGGDRRLRARIEVDVLTKASQLCHHVNNTMLCRGARDHQLTIFYRMGFLEAATDEAWEKKLKEIYANDLEVPTTAARRI